MDEILSCPICLEQFHKDIQHAKFPKSLSTCGHNFCSECTFRLNFPVECPVCKQTNISAINNHTLAQITDKLEELKGKEEKEEKEQKYQKQSVEKVKSGESMKSKKKKKKKRNKKKTVNLAANEFRDLFQRWNEYFGNFLRLKFSMPPFPSSDCPCCIRSFKHHLLNPNGQCSTCLKFRGLHPFFNETKSISFNSDSDNYGLKIADYTDFVGITDEYKNMSVYYKMSQYTLKDEQTYFLLEGHDVYQDPNSIRVKHRNDEFVKRTIHNVDNVYIRAPFDKHGKCFLSPLFVSKLTLIRETIKKWESFLSAVTKLSSPSYFNVYFVRTNAFDDIPITILFVVGQGRIFWNYSDFHGGINRFIMHAYGSDQKIITFDSLFELNNVVDNDRKFERSYIAIEFNPKYFFKIDFLTGKFTGILALFDDQSKEYIEFSNAGFISDQS